MQWVDINLHIGTRGQARIRSLIAESTAFSKDTALGDITQNLPLAIADGLLVRLIWHRLNHC